VADDTPRPWEVGCHELLDSLLRTGAQLDCVVDRGRPELQFSSEKCGREVLELIVGYASLNHIVIYKRVIPVVQSLCYRKVKALTRLAKRTIESPPLRPGDRRTSNLVLNVIVDACVTLLSIGLRYSRRYHPTTDQRVSNEQLNETIEVEPCKSANRNERALLLRFFEIMMAQKRRSVWRCDR
jgi:hypothetical protein